MTALQPQVQQITLEEYEALPESRRVEVFEGIVYDMASPSQLHQAISMQLSTIINNYILGKKGACSIFSAPFDVKLNDDPLLIVQPDIMVVCDKDKLDGKRCNGAPDFIIEIVSPGNLEDDYIRKAYHYQNYGVREYWIVDPMRKLVTVHYFEGGMVNVQYSFDDIVKVSIYDDLSIDFPELARILDM